MKFYRLIHLYSAPPERDWGLYESLQGLRERMRRETKEPFFVEEVETDSIRMYPEDAEDETDTDLGRTPKEEEL